MSFSTGCSKPKVEAALGSKPRKPQQHHPTALPVLASTALRTTSSLEESNEQCWCGQRHTCYRLLTEAFHLRMTVVFERIPADLSKGGDVGVGCIPNRERKGDAIVATAGVLLYIGETD